VAAGRGGCACTGLSRRRSRVRIPSLPSLKVPAKRHPLLSDEAPAPGFRAANGQRRASRVCRVPSPKLLQTAPPVFCLCNRGSGLLLTLPPRATNDFRSDSIAAQGLGLRRADPFNNSARRCTASSVSSFLIRLIKVAESKTGPHGTSSTARVYRTGGSQAPAHAGLVDHRGAAADRVLALMAAVRGSPTGR
jgi:hypothetical protein